MDKRLEKIQNVTLWGAVCNLALSILKLLAGIFGHSAAMVADAVHSFSDLISDIIIFIFARISVKDKDKSFDYGYGKFETLATLALSILLLATGGKMLGTAVKNIHAVLVDGVAIPSPGYLALSAAILSIIVKEILYQWTAKVGHKVSSQAVVANAWHHRTDAMSSLGSLLGIGGAIVLGGKWTILDPLVCVGISILIIVIAVKMMIPALSELTEASLPEAMEKEIADIAASVEGVQDVHAMKSRNCGRYSVVEFHIVVAPETSVSQAHEITVKAEELLRAKFGHEMQISIHIEPSKDSL